MIITNVHATEGTRAGSTFCIQSYSEYNQINLLDIVKLIYDNKNYYFEVVDIKANSSIGAVVFIANEVGYYNLLSKRKIDIRTLIDKEVILETDKEVLNKLEKERGYT